MPTNVRSVSHPPVPVVVGVSAVFQYTQIPTHAAASQGRAWLYMCMRIRADNIPESTHGLQASSPLACPRLTDYRRGCAAARANFVDWAACSSAPLRLRAPRVESLYRINGLVSLPLPESSIRPCPPNERRGARHAPYRSSNTWWPLILTACVQPSAAYPSPTTHDGRKDTRG